MIIDWRSLLNSIHVEWRDRGSNCRSGNVNVACPWCGNDPSFHLGIAEGREAYYCYRDPDRHSGRSFVSLLVKLRIGREEAVRLLNSYVSRPTAPPEEAKPISPDAATKAWTRFVPAGVSDPVVNYLFKRGVSDPGRAIAQYDIRVAQAGTWAQRLLLPFYSSERVVWTWTGRGVHASMIPKYLTQPSADAGLIYVPDWYKQGKKCLVITEGPFDALKLAVACRDSPYIVAALTGKGFNPSRQLKLRKLAEGCDSVLLALDSDVTTATTFRIISDIAGFLRVRYVGRARLPSGYKDPAELPQEGILPWLNKQKDYLVKR